MPRAFSGGLFRRREHRIHRQMDRLRRLVSCAESRADLGHVAIHGLERRRDGPGDTAGSWWARHPRAADSPSRRCIRCPFPRPIRRVLHRWRKNVEVDYLAHHVFHVRAGQQFEVRNEVAAASAPGLLRPACRSRDPLGPNFARCVARHAVKRKGGEEVGWVFSSEKLQSGRRRCQTVRKATWTGAIGASSRTVLRSRRPQTRLDTFCTRTGRLDHAARLGGGA